MLEFPFACQIYEDAYLMNSYQREYFWLDLAKHASNVFDYQPSDVESGLDYMIQKAAGTHLQDIAVRRVFKRRGWTFQGKELIQIRSHDTYWGANFSPGRIPFQIPERIVKPQLEGWWNLNSVEDFWQSNKVLQIIGEN